MTRTLIIATSLVAAMTTGVLADTVDRRQANQAQRIEDARRAGELTRREQAALQAEQARIRALERSVKADGVVTRREARILDRAQDNAGRHIASESHDREKARGNRWFWR